MNELKKFVDIVESGDVANRLLYLHGNGDIKLIESEITSYDLFNEIRRMEQENTLKEFLYDFVNGNGDLTYAFDTCIGCLEMALYSITLRLEGGIQMQCYECGKEIKNDVFWEYGDEVICKECRNNHYMGCEDCGDLTYTDDIVDVNNDTRIVCPRCAEDYYMCDHCEGLYDNHHIATNYHHTLCEDCYNDNYFTCYDCGHVYHLDDARNVDDCYYCDDCADEYNEHSDVIYNYSYQPSPVFYGGPAFGYYGLEVEIDDGNDRWSAAEDIDDVGDGHIYLKEDGSLSYDGMEIVTHPATLDYHMSDLPWDDICDTAIDHGYLSHDTDTCGLHIHASRTLFGGIGVKQDLTIAKIMLLVDRWYDTHIVNFARRDISKMRRWANKPNADIKPGDDDGDAVHKSKKNANDRYRAINLCNYATVEFRFFRGTLKRDTIIASIQWVDTIIDYCKRTQLKDLFKATWDDIFANTGHVELTNYLKQRDLYNLKEDK